MRGIVILLVIFASGMIAQIQRNKIVSQNSKIGLKIKESYKEAL